MEVDLHLFLVDVSGVLLRPPPKLIDLILVLQAYCYLLFTKTHREGLVSPVIPSRFISYTRLCLGLKYNAGCKAKGINLGG